MLAVFLRCREQLVKRDVYHDAGHGREDERECRSASGQLEAEYGCDSPAEQCAQHLTHTGQGRIGQSLHLALCSIIYRYGYCYAFRDVVYGYGCRDAGSGLRVVQRSYECRYSFRKVVYGYGQRGHESESVQGLLVSGLTEHVDGRSLRVKRETRRLVRVFIFGDCEVDQRDDAHSGKECQQYEGLSMGNGPYDFRLSLGIELRQRDEYHHAGAQSERSRQEIAAELLPEEHERAADARRGTGNKRHKQCSPNSVHVLFLLLCFKCSVYHIYNNSGIRYDRHRLCPW